MATVAGWPALIGNMRGAVRDLQQAALEVIETFFDMVWAMHGGTALDGKTKEPIALATSAVFRCGHCIAHHAEGAVKQGASRAEISDAMAMAVHLGAGPSVMHVAQPLEAID